MTDTSDAPAQPDAIVAELSDEHAKIPPERFELVREMWLRGVDPLRIQSDLSQKYSITTRQVRRYIELVRGALREHGKQDPESARTRAEQMFLETYELAKVRTIKGQPAPDTKSMAIVTARLAEMHGAFVVKHEHTGKDGAPLGVAATIFIPQEKPTK